MARPRNATQSRKLEITLPPNAGACLDYLSKMGRFGNTASEVARFLILREIDDLSRSKMLPDDLSA